MRFFTFLHEWKNDCLAAENSLQKTRRIVFQLFPFDLFHFTYTFEHCIRTPFLYGLKENNS